MNEQPLVNVCGITKKFPGVCALDNVDFKLQRGDIHAIMGENGAGKSTLIKVLAGIHRADAGKFYLEGNLVDPASAIEAQQLGISSVFQEVSLLPDLSVAENLLIGQEPRGVWGIRWRRVRERAIETLARLDIRLDVSLPLRSFSLAIQQMVAIARTLDANAKVLILDEPTSSLDAAEVQRLFSLMRTLRDGGLGIIFITHFLDQVYAVSDHVTVLRDGRFVGEFETSEISKVELISKMIGRKSDVSTARAIESADQQTRAEDVATPLLEACGLHRHGAVEHVDLSITKGQIVGLAGLLGSGRTETARLLFGIDRAHRGRILLQGQPVKRHSPRAAIRLGLAFAPEDRRDAGIVPELSVRENIILALQARRGWLWRIHIGRQRELADKYIKELNIVTTDQEKPVGHLSGGNQQKVILARLLAMHPKLLILDEPTRGIDVGAKAEIEQLMTLLCHDGTSILFISSELEEVIHNCHIVVVMRNRRSVGQLSGSNLTLPTIIEMIASKSGKNETHV